jgi:hypothetical protein
MALPNKAMQLTKLRAAPGRACKVPPCAPAGQTGGGTASQLIASVRRTWQGGKGAPHELHGSFGSLASQRWRKP